ncbi:hypothetical protein RRG08_024012 [Elysia crispata]|uniref:Uncharacterized protein n=1 Tax=Elysia crispata TaxID=231223 RepID=A0AAE0YP12_9GAST|nr:hypothetical protein RRG08_024012 [Elysia crispata]
MVSVLSIGSTITPLRQGGVSSGQIQTLCGPRGNTALVACGSDSSACRSYVAVWAFPPLAPSMLAATGSKPPGAPWAPSTSAARIRQFAEGAASSISDMSDF